jgi:hypothetical protein
VTVEQLSAHKDNYLTTDFDVVASSFGNAFYTTDKENGEYIWTPSSSHKKVIEKILQNPIADLKKAAFDYILVAKATDLSPASGFCTCARKTCKLQDSCPFIPNYPSVKFDSSTGEPVKPWNSLRGLEGVLLEVLSRK